MTNQNQEFWCKHQYQWPIKYIVIFREWTMLNNCWPGNNKIWFTLKMLSTLWPVELVAGRDRWTLTERYWHTGGYSKTQISSFPPPPHSPPPPLWKHFNNFSKKFNQATNSLGNFFWMTCFEKVCNFCQNIYQWTGTCLHKWFFFRFRLRGVQSGKRIRMLSSPSSPPVLDPLLSTLLSLNSTMLDLLLDLTQLSTMLSNNSTINNKLSTSLLTEEDKLQKTMQQCLIQYWNQSLKNC